MKAHKYMPIPVMSPFAMQPNFVRYVMISQISILKPIRVIQILIFIIHNIDVTNVNFVFREGKDGLQRQTDILAMVKDFSSKEKLSSWVIHYEVTIPLSKPLNKIVISSFHKIVLTLIGN